ncbi:MAG: 3-isopropylmalate dehydratase small subunit [Sphingomonadaceae bacterium]
MTPVRTVEGRAIPFGAANVDTDLIIPARFLKSLTREGLGRGAFAALREQPDNPFDGNAGAPILVAGENFGCGSSREHAPWALLDLGIRVVIAPSFADIFAGNSFKNGLLLVQLPREAVDRLMAVAAEGLPITVDLESQTVTTPYQDRFDFPIDPFRKQCLLDGLDEIALTLAEADALAAHEARLAAERPWVAGAANR